MKYSGASQPRILLFDIETAPNLSYTWAKWEQNVIAFETEWYVLCFAAKWLDKKTFAYSLPDFPHYRKDRENDKALVKELWNLFDQADVVVAHNGDGFDIKKVNARFAYYNFPPPSPYKTVDTLKIARRYYGFNSNKLDDLGDTLGLGRKVETGGFSLWKGCLQGDLKSWAKMVRYNKQDVELLQKVYKRFLPWMKSHPNIGIYIGRPVCPKCGSNDLQSRGIFRGATMQSKKFQCNNCGGWMSQKLKGGVSSI